MDEFKHTPKNPFKMSEDTQVEKNQDRTTIESEVPEPTTPEPDFTIDMSLDDNKSNNTVDELKPKGSGMTKKKKIIILVSMIAILILAGAIYWFVIKKDAKPSVKNTNTVVVKKTEKPKTISPLTGVELSDASLATRPVTGLMIENSPDSRPQSGINEAGVVVEAVAEGGITRFLVIFQDTKPQYIGPVRSARPYYIDYALGFDAGYGHVGGSPDALNDIKSLGVKDLDQFFNSGAYWRINERSAPHNVYTSFEKLDELNKAKGYSSSKYTPLERKKDVPQTPTAVSIDFNISGPLYSPHFQYDGINNNYKRSQGGEAHVDLKSGAQIAPKVVIAIITDKGYMSDGSHSTYRTTGTGKVYVFQDGIVSEGTWQKTARNSSLVLTDKNGLPMKLNAGQTWISLLGAPSDVSYKP